MKRDVDSMAEFGVQAGPTVFTNGKGWERQSSAFDLAELRVAVEAA